jgi:hypothetical protein
MRRVSKVEAKEAVAAVVLGPSTASEHSDQYDTSLEKAEDSFKDCSEELIIHKDKLIPWLTEEFIHCAQEPQPAELQLQESTEVGSPFNYFST